MAWLLRKPPLPCHRGGEPSGWVGGGVGVPAHIYIYINHISIIYQSYINHIIIYIYIISDINHLHQQSPSIIFINHSHIYPPCFSTSQAPKPPKPIETPPWLGPGTACVASPSRLPRRVIGPTPSRSTCWCSGTCNPWVPAPLRRGHGGKQHGAGSWSISHMLHVWNIYLHSPQKWPKCR